MSCPRSRVTVSVCQRREETEEGHRDVCVQACHFALHSYAAARSAKCCEIYNYGGVLCYDSTAASGDSTSQRQEPTACVCKHRDSTRPQTLAALCHRHGTRRGPRGPARSAAPICTAAVAPPHLSDGVMRSHVTMEWQSCSSRSVTR